jgi:hypothetical protein
MSESLPSGRAGRRIAILLVLAPRHAEIPDIHFVDHMQDQRSIFGKITWRI